MEDTNVKVISKDGKKELVDGEWVQIVTDGSGNYGGRLLSTKEKAVRAREKSLRNEWEKKTYFCEEGYYRVETYHEKLGLLLHNPLNGEMRFVPFSEEDITGSDRWVGISSLSGEEGYREISEEEAMERAKEYLLTSTNYIHLY